MEPPYGIPVLTLIMGATMLLQQKMQPPMGDATQAKMMMLMPVVFTFIFINFSAGLVLYWLTNNVLSIGQQYYTQKNRPNEGHTLGNGSWIRRKSLKDAVLKERIKKGQFGV